MVISNFRTNHFLNRICCVDSWALPVSFLTPLSSTCYTPKVAKLWRILVRYVVAIEIWTSLIQGTKAVTIWALHVVSNPIGFSPPPTRPKTIWEAAFSLFRLLSYGKSKCKQVFNCLCFWYSIQVTECVPFAWRIAHFAAGTCTFIPVHRLNGKRLSLVAKICSVWNLFLTQWSDWKEFHYMAGHFFFLWGIWKVNAILSSLKLPQNFIILTSKSTPHCIQRTRGLELATAACLTLVKFHKARESSKQGQGQCHAVIHPPLFLPSLLSLHPLEWTTVYIHFNNFRHPRF